MSIWVTLYLVLPAVHLLVEPVERDSGIRFVMQRVNYQTKTICESNFSARNRLRSDQPFTLQPKPKRGSRNKQADSICQKMSERQNEKTLEAIRWSYDRESGAKLLSILDQLQARKKCQLRFQKG